jgi:hypothetical protein
MDNFTSLILARLKSEMDIERILGTQADKKLKNAFKHYKSFNRLWMPIAVPDCHPKTPKINKHENGNYFTVLDIIA